MGKYSQMAPTSINALRTAERQRSYLAAVAERAQRLHVAIDEVVELVGSLNGTARHFGIDGAAEALVLVPLDNPERPLQGCELRSQKIELINRALRLCDEERDYELIAA